MKAGDYFEEAMIQEKKRQEKEGERSLSLNCAPQILVLFEPLATKTSSVGKKPKTIELPFRQCVSNGQLCWVLWEATVNFWEENKVGKIGISVQAITCLVINWIHKIPIEIFRIVSISPRL